MTFALLKSWDELAAEGSEFINEDNMNQPEITIPLDGGILYISSDFKNILGKKVPVYKRDKHYPDGVFTPIDGGYYIHTIMIKETNEH